jgi:hypothetical protein
MGSSCSPTSAGPSIPRGSGTGSLRRGGVRIVCMVVVLQAACQGHDALNPRLFLFEVHTRLLLGLLAGRLAGSPRLQLPSNALQIVWHLRVCLEEEQFQIPGLVLQLDLCPVLQDVRDCPLLPEEGENLAPMRPLDHVKAGHERLLLLRGPWPPSRVQAFASRGIGRLCNGGLAGFLIEGRSRHGLVGRQVISICSYGRWWSRPLRVRLVV